MILGVHVTIVIRAREEKKSKKKQDGGRGYDICGKTACQTLSRKSE